MGIGAINSRLFFLSSFGMAAFCIFLTIKRMRYFPQWLFFDENFPYLGLE